MGNINAADDTTSTPAPVVLFGLDQSGKAHASRFPAEQAEQAIKAAKVMGMHVLSLGGEVDSLVDGIAEGRIFAKTGSAFVPFVARATFDHLTKIAGMPIAPPAPKAAKPAKAASEKAKGEENASAKGRKPTKAAPTSPPQVAPYVEPTNVPQDWPHICQGSLVLATTGEVGSAWFECSVVEVKDDHLVALVWRDFETPLFLRRRNQLALLPEGTPLKADA